MSEQIIRPGVPTSGRVTPASFPFYTTGEDNLRLTSWNAASGVRLTLNGRLLDASGKASPDRWDHIPNTDRSAKTSDITLSGSTLLNLTVFATAGAPQMGQTFVKVELIRGLGTAAIVLGTILQGYVTSAQALGWPGSPLQSSVDSGGYYRVVNGTQPALGGEISETVPAGARWLLLSVSASLTTSAAAGNRVPGLKFKSGANGYFGSGQNGVAGPGATITFVWATGMPLAALVGSVGGVAGLLDGNCLLAGFTFSTITTLLAAGDQWASIAYLVREFLEP